MKPDHARAVAEVVAVVVDTVAVVAVVDAAAAVAVEAVVADTVVEVAAVDTRPFDSRKPSQK